MGDNVISSANLNYIESNLSILSKNIATVANNLEIVSKNVEYVSNQVGTVDLKVESITTELNDLATEFKAFVDESKRIAALADAKQTVIMLEQELEKNFGHYDTIRKHTVGILQASDISVVRKETIANATEEMMLSAPRYWLAPALIALSAWLSDNKELAERALKEAMKRDDEKTSLLFCLISRRAGRLDGSLVWLERYFGMQDPTKMERRIIVVLDAFASGLFGADAKGICSEKIKAWLDELSARVGFIESQKEQWSNAILGKKSFLNDNEFPYLNQYSPTWQQLKEVLELAKTHDDIYTYFSNIFNTHVENVEAISAKIDEVLDNLVTNYDNEELPLQKQLRKSRLVIEENGNQQRATARLDSELPAYDQYEDFSQHLTSVALYPESSGALIATQKLAISLSKEWIKNAYEDLTVKSRSNVPMEVEINISEWRGKTRDGSNEAELEMSLEGYVNNIRDTALAKIKWFTSKVIIAIIAGLVLSILGIATIIIPLLVITGVGIFVFREKRLAENQKKATIAQIEEFRNNAQIALKATLAEVVDFRRLYAEKDADYKKVIDFLNELSPTQYISVVNSKVTRQVL